MKIKVKLLTVLVLVLCNVSCFSQNKSEFIKVTNWNVQTFFDSENDGNEYSEFVKSKTWGKNAYVKRIKNLVEVITALDSDVFVMEEIENQEVLMDISNFLNNGWNFGKEYKYGTFVKDEGSSIGIGVISRFPVENVKIHDLDVEGEEMPLMRPVLEFTVKCKNQNVVILANHWKSMSGGKEETEMWRNAQEIVVSRILSEKDNLQNKILILGDFNRDINDFCVEGDDVLIRSGKGFDFDGNAVRVKSGWFWNKDVKIGSYYYNEKWNRIDQIFYLNCEILDFFPETNGQWCDEETCVPKRYSIYKETGYSDHLPVSVLVKI